MMPLWMTATLPLTSVCGCALRSVGPPWVAQRVWPIPVDPVQRDLAGVDVVLEIGQHAGLLRGVQAACTVQDGDAGGVVPAVLQPAQAFEDQRERLTGTGVSDDATHALKANGCNAGLRHPQLIRVAGGGSAVMTLTAGGGKRIVRAAAGRFRGDCAAPANAGRDGPRQPGMGQAGPVRRVRWAGLRQAGLDRAGPQASTARPPLDIAASGGTTAAGGPGSGVA